MGKLDPNTIIGILQGKLGDLVFARMKDGTVAVRHKPVREAPSTPGELASQEQHKKALAYVTRLRQSPAQYIPYQEEARVRGKRACDLAHADFRQAPRIHDIDLSAYSGRAGEAIAVEAIDDFEVSAVIVAITAADAEGTVFENGPARLEEMNGRWSYITTVALPPGQIVIVHASVCDRAGNMTIKSVHHPISRSGPER